jgi:hypothetical protein
MISKIKLIQIKDTYQGNKDILIPLVKALKNDPFLPEIILCHKSLEWIEELQTYEPLPFFSYLIKAYKLAYPTNQEQLWLSLNGIIIPEYMSLNEQSLTGIMESSKLKILLSKGDTAITAYANNIGKKEELLNKLSRFGQLVNNAEVDNDTK